MRIKRPVRVTFLVTAVEKTALDTLARNAGVTVSEWIRAKVRDCSPPGLVGQGRRA